MIESRQARYWTSHANPNAHGVEFGFGRESIDALRHAMTSFENADIAGASFLLFPIVSTCEEGLKTAVFAVKGFAKRVHVCLAIDEATLACVSLSDCLPPGIGLCLDNVTPKTSLGAFLEASIEAVRFSPKFVAAAADNFRLGVALQALVGLAHDLGIRTLGPECELESTPGVLRFDYVPKTKVTTPGSLLNWTSATRKRKPSRAARASAGSVERHRE